LALVLRILDENHFIHSEERMTWYLQKRPQLQYNRDELLSRRKNTAACVSLSKSTISKTNTGKTGPTV